MDKKAWIVIIACSLGLYFWLDTQKEYQKQLQKQKDNAEQNSEDVNQETEGTSNKEKNKEVIEEQNSSSLISRLSSNVKEKALNVGSKAMSIVSEVTNKPFDNKLLKKEEISSVVEKEANTKVERIEPTFLEEGKNETSFKNSKVINKEIFNQDDGMNIPSFLRRNKD